MTANSTSPITLTGPAQPSGVYLLWIGLAEEAALSFGKFRQGERFQLPAGNYVYIGSAHGKRGASSLGYRLLRHATRTNGVAHPIRPRLLKTLQEKGLPAKNPTQKTCHWHIDHLLDHPASSLQGVDAWMTDQHLEAALADKLAQMPETSIVVPGLGASDHAGGTHLLLFSSSSADVRWWAQLVGRIRDDGNLFL